MAGRLTGIDSRRVADAPKKSAPEIPAWKRPEDR
jgi:hypothetical protein